MARRVAWNLPGNLLRFKIFDVGKTQSDVLLFAIAGQRIRHREVNFRLNSESTLLKLFLLTLIFLFPIKAGFPLP